jgi:hypothetical protein
MVRPSLIEGPAPLARPRAPQPDYNDLVRYYTTKPMNGGVTFKCVACNHAVNTLEFDHTKGNRRTQAAAAINQHARELHFSQFRMTAPMKLGGRGVL